MNLLKRFSAIFVSPSRLFSEIKSEDYKPTLMYFFIFILGLDILSFIISLVTGATIMIKNTIIGWVTSIVSVLVFAFFLGLVASWFGGSRSWAQGLKAAVYPGTIFAVFGVVMSVLGSVFKTTIPNLTNPQTILANLGTTIGIGIVIVLVVLALFIWTIVLYVKGTSISLDLSGGKALGTLIIAAILNAVVLGIISWFLTVVGLLEKIEVTV